MSAIVRPAGRRAEMNASVRPAGPADAAAIAAVYAPYVTDSVASFEDVAPGAATMEQRRTSHGMPWYVAESGGTVVGYAYSSPHRDRAAYRWSVDVSVYCSVSRQGVGRALYDRLLGVLTELGHVRAHAGITLPNAASVGLHEALNFVAVAHYPSVGYKFGAWHDVGWWSRPLAPAVVAPVPPRTWDGRA